MSDPTTPCKSRRILVTSALPYINGPIHLGHIVEGIQTDIWVRFQKMRGNECYYVCADDTHGTATLLRAQNEGVDPETLIQATQEQHERDYEGFGIGFDTFYTTHSKENRAFVEGIYEKLVAGGHVYWDSVRQFFDPEKEIFLADRFIKGTCPRCKSENQNGDTCDACGGTHSPADLINPRSALSGATPVERESDHLFVRLSDFEDVLREWVSTDRLQSEVVNKLSEWFEEGLRDWDVSRDAPYFGFKIPGTGPDAKGNPGERPTKYFYVWVDAPVGYLAAFQKLCEETEGLEFDDFLKADSEAEMYHFIGKDILYFHCLFWPALLHAGGFRLPTSVPVHGFLTVDGTKMSKSRGTFVLARTFLDHLPAEPLRYYFAARFGSGLGDIDLNLEDFVLRVNSDLVGKVVNIASRCAGFLHRLNQGQLSAELHNPELFETSSESAAEIADLLEQREYNRAVRKIMSIADEANRYIDEQQPWQLAKDETKTAEVQAICTTGINLFRLLMIYLKPILPQIAGEAEKFLGVEPLTWADAATPLTGHTINNYEPLLTRLDVKAVKGVIEASKADQAAALAAAPPAEEALDLEDEIQIDAFSKVDLRVARVKSAHHVEGAAKLLKLDLDVGAEQRQVFSGIKASYTPEELEGTLVVLVANLAPRKMRFGISEGMVLASGQGDQVRLVRPQEGSVPGDRIS